MIVIQIYWYLSYFKEEKIYCSDSRNCSINTVQPVFYLSIIQRKFVRRKNKNCILAFYFINFFVQTYFSNYANYKNFNRR